MKASKTVLGSLFAVAIALYFAGPYRLNAQSEIEPSATKASDSSNWNILVNRIDPGEANVEPAFQVAIYENLIEELTKTKRFGQVFRSGDRRASEASDVLILNTMVEKYTPGSETRRAVTTFSGATKLRVNNQLCTKDGRVLFQWVGDGNVRFFGGNLRATHKLARHVAQKLERASLPSSGSHKTNEASSGGNAVAMSDSSRRLEIRGDLPSSSAAASGEQSK